MSDCNLASVQASVAACAAVADLTAGLDFVFDRLGDEGKPYSDSSYGTSTDTMIGDPGDELQYHLDQLCQQAERYTDSSLQDNAGEEWSW